MKQKVVRCILVLLGALLILGTVMIGMVVLKKPSLQRNWSDDARLLPAVTLPTLQNPDTLIVEHMRDWRYGSSTVVTKDYYNESFDLSKISQAYFLINPFGERESVAHTFFLFEFEDGKTVSVSVEARRPEGIEYDVTKGLLNTYEMWYVWGSAADLFGRRAVYNNEDLYMYPLLVSTSTARGLLVDLAHTTESLETKPEFYNTVFSNCTNVLADAANRVNKGSIPWSYERVLTGYSDNKLYEYGLIPHDKSFDEIFKEARIDEIIRGLVKEKGHDYSKEDFWVDLKKTRPESI